MRSETPPFVTRGLPGPGHAALTVLEGKWRTTISLFMAQGTPAVPVVSSDIVTERAWINDGRFLRDTTTGTIGGMPYLRIGFLGYDNLAERVEWVTMDGVQAGIMFYQGAARSGFDFPVNVAGSFVDQGVLGESYSGKTLGMRTEIIVKDANEHVFDLYFTPPGETERIADHNVYKRIG